MVQSVTPQEFAQFGTAYVTNLLHRLHIRFFYCKSLVLTSTKTAS